MSMFKGKNLHIANFLSKLIPLNRVGGGGGGGGAQMKTEELLPLDFKALFIVLA